MAGATNTTVSDVTTSEMFIDFVSVDVEAILGHATLTVAELRALSDGDVVPLDTQINEAVSLRINGRVIGRGELVTVDDCFAVRIVELGA